MSESTKPQWNLFPGGAPPEEIVIGWRQLGALSEGAVQNLGGLIELALSDDPDGNHEQVIQQFCQRFGVDPGAVVGAVRACDYLLRQGAAFDVPAEAFRADLELLSGGAAMRELPLLTTHYDQIKARLRAGLIEDTLADHGNVLTGFSWRIDRVDASSHGRMGDTSVVLLNLAYRSGEERQQLSLQLAPPAVIALRNFLNGLEGGD